MVSLMKKFRGLAAALALVLAGEGVTGCVLRLKGQEVLGVNPDARIMVEHPEIVATNEIRVVH